MDSGLHVSPPASSWVKLQWPVGAGSPQTDWPGLPSGLNLLLKSPMRSPGVSWPPLRLAHSTVQPLSLGGRHSWVWDADKPPMTTGYCGLKAQVAPTGSGKLPCLRRTRNLRPGTPQLSSQLADTCLLSHHANLSEPVSSALGLFLAATWVMFSESSLHKTPARGRNVGDPPATVTCQSWQDLPLATVCHLLPLGTQSNPCQNSAISQAPHL